MVATHGGTDKGWSQMGWDLPARYRTNVGETEADYVAQAGRHKGPRAHTAFTWCPTCACDHQ